MSVRKRSSEAKVANCYRAFLIDQDIRRLQIAMNYVCRVKEVDAAQQIVQYMKHLVVAETLRPVTRENLLQVQVNEINDEEYLIERFKGSISNIFFIRYNDIMKLRGKQIIVHFG